MWKEDRTMTPNEQAREIPDMPRLTRREVLLQQAITTLQATLAERDWEVKRLKADRDNIWKNKQEIAANHLAAVQERDALRAQRDALVEALNTRERRAHDLDAPTRAIVLETTRHIRATLAAGKEGISNGE